MITQYGIAGAITQSGAQIKTVLIKGTAIAAGTPIKLDDTTGEAKELAAGDTLDKFAGIIVRDPAPFQRANTNMFDGALTVGFIQVAIKEGDSPRIGGAVYYDPANHYFTTTAASMVQIPAKWAANGQASGCAEIEVVPYFPNSEGA